MDTQHGTWGIRTRTFRTDSCLVTILELKPKKRCSWHRHKQSWNQFYVIAGRLGIRTDIGPDGQQSVTNVEEGQSFTVPPEINHEFFTLEEPATVEEVAYVRYDESDIYRKRLGGDIE